MNRIDIENKKIEYKGQWLSADEITKAIQDKIESGDMKFAGFAAALEELNKAVEDSQTIHLRLTLSSADYEKLMELGQGDEHESVLKAVEAFIKTNSPVSVHPGEAEASIDNAKKNIVKCASCGHPIEVPPGGEHGEIKCSKCGARGKLKPRA